MKIAKKAFEDMAQFEYLKKVVTNQSVVQEEMKSRLDSGGAIIQSRTFCLLIYCLKT
jgi:hypothetical protein